ncbi:MAG: glycosyltransferase, partial [Delftia sp.]|nr:glycosyltransferase [Delftia sp.]
MKLIVQIPCYNEAQTLPLVLQSIPRQIEGLDEVLVLIIDDGSSDDTLEAARRHGADYIVRHAGNRG